MTTLSSTNNGYLDCLTWRETPQLQKIKNKNKNIATTTEQKETRLYTPEKLANLRSYLLFAKLADKNNENIDFMQRCTITITLKQREIYELVW